jgi:hypothetical protein
MRRCQKGSYELGKVIYGYGKRDLLTPTHLTFTVPKETFLCGKRDLVHKWNRPINTGIPEVLRLACGVWKILIELGRTPKRGSECVYADRTLELARVHEELREFGESWEAVSFAFLVESVPQSVVQRVVGWAGVQA